MKIKITLLILLLFTCISTFAQLTVTAIKTNGTCAANGTITATASGNTGTVNYQLLQGSTVVQSYRTSNVFNNLPAGTYTVQVQDASNSTTAQSSAVTITTSYVAMSVTVTNGSVGCATAIGSITATVTSGKLPYSYSISPDPNGVGTQSSNIFSNLPIGSYTMSVTDACNVTVTAAGSVALGTSTTTATVAPRYGTTGGVFVYDSNGNLNNNCSSTKVYIGGGWGYVGNGSSNLSPFDNNHFYWRYRYPAGSGGTIYGANGVVNGPLIPCSTYFAAAPATATYPYGTGDLIVYDDCGNSTILTNGLVSQLLTGNDWARGDYDCVNGGILNVSTNGLDLLCMPVQWTFTDTTTGVVTLETSTVSGVTSFTGYIPGHTYKVKGTDAQGHNATNTTQVTIPSSPNAVSWTGYYPDYDFLHAGLPRIAFPNASIVAQNSTFSYTVTASSSGNPAVGYTYTGSSSPPSGFIPGPLPLSNGYRAWPDGTYTISITIGCLTSPLTFTIGDSTNKTLSATLNSETITPVCGGFNLTENATLNNPSLYGFKIISGPSNVGQIRTFGSSTTASTLNSNAFNGLTYGTYTFALISIGTSTGTGGGTTLLTKTVTYTASNSLTIDALATGGYVCAGQPTGSLTVTASSASGSALQYSIDNGVTYQSSNVFTSVAVGTYPVIVKDICGNTATYNASVVQASGISATASPNPVCVGGTDQLSVNAIGATSYAWVGPNGYTSSLQNPTLTNVQLTDAGVYTVTVTSPSCVNVASVTVVVTALPTATISYSGSPFCATGTITPTITGTTGGTFSSTAGLSINNSTGVINLASSATGTYTVIYAFADGVTGCTNSTTTSITVNALPLVITHNQSTCAPSTVNLTTVGVTSGSTSGLTFTYYTDAAGTTILSNPTSVAISGTYYIKGYLASTGCYSAITPVTVTINVQPTVVITNPASVCINNTVDITADAITAGSSADLVYAYYTNAAGTIVLTNPTTIATSGTYYIQGINTISGCTSNVMPVVVSITDTTAPVTPTLADVTGTCTATATAPTTTDACAGTITGTTTDALTYTTQGTHIIHWTFNDGNGNSTTANQNVIITDTTAPVTPTLADITGQCTATATAPTTTDVCVGTITGTTTDALTYTTQGTHIIHWTFNDGNGNSTTANQNVIITIPSAPTGLACYQTATFNTTTCVWDVTGTQPTTPTVLCYQTATWNGTTCQYDVTGTQPTAPTVLCYQTATWNGTTCQYDVTGTQPTAPTVLCYQTATWNGTTCQYDVTGTQPTAPTVLCYQTATWNGTTCQYDVTGTQPTAPTVLCYQTATWNGTTCQYDVTGTQPAPPTVLCYQTATWNGTTCQYDVTGMQPTAPTVLCYQTATWNATSCQYDITGTQPVLSYQYPDTVCNDDTGLTVDMQSIVKTQFPEIIATTGTWSITPATTGLNSTTGVFTPYGLAVGNYIIKYNSNDSQCPKVVEITIAVNITCNVLDCGSITVYNAVSPNNDGLNDIFYIKNIDNTGCYPENTVEIYNRWGVLVFERNNYNNTDRAFKGFSEGRTTIKQSEELPMGTYFYIIKYKASDSSTHEKSGYLYLVP